MAVRWRFNPCCIGNDVERRRTRLRYDVSNVLILVIMEMM